MDTSKPAILPLAAPDEDALMRKLAQLREQASSANPHAPAAFLRAASGSSAPLPLRAAVVATSCEEVASGAERLERRLLQFPRSLPCLSTGIVAARPDAVSSIGLLFPGQGSPVKGCLGPLGQHVPTAADVHRRVGLPRSELPKELTQLAIVASSIAALCALDSFGVEARFAIGHSLGELVALHWAGAYDRKTLLRLARLRGVAMTRDAAPNGAMVALRADESQLPALLAGGQAVVACFNTPRQHVVSGEAEAVEAVYRRARAQRVMASRLDVSGAFHSPLMATAAQTFGRRIEPLQIGPISRSVASTVTGSWIQPNEDIRALLVRQIDSPVRFAQAVEIAANADLLIEAGPGKVLSGLVRELTGTPVVSLSTDGDERSLHEGVAALWACGALKSAPAASAAAFTAVT